METRVAAYVVLRDAEKRILLCRWKRDGKSAWTMPGGGLAFGERPEDAARREVREETGLRAAIGRPLGADSRVVPAAHRLDGGQEDLHQIRIFYEAAVAGGRLRGERRGPITHARWFAPAEVPAQRFALVDAARRWFDAGSEQAPFVPPIDEGTQMSTSERWVRRNAQTRVNAYAVITSDDQVLLSRWAARNAWTLTGGQLDPGETPAAAAARFTFAETGYVIELGPLRWVDSRVHPPWAERPHPQQAISLYSEARIVGGEPALPDPEVTQTDRAEWFPIEALPQGAIREVVSALRALGFPAARESGHAPPVGPGRVSPRS